MSWRPAASITERTRRITAAKSTCGSPASTPNSGAPRIAWARAALASRAFDGTQPVHRQSPPVRSRSIIAVRAPSPAAVTVAISPVVPPPIAIRSWRPLIAVGC